MKSVEHYGYYMFLGLGDFGQPAALTPDWTSTWGRDEWASRLDRLAALGANTLFIYLLGNWLPFDSQDFPDCVEQGHPNVRKDFFQDVLDMAAARGIEVVATFTTTGHASGYVGAHRHLATDGPDGSCGTSILCHHKTGAAEYPLAVIEDCLTRYHGFSGVILHPPEFSHPCSCPACRAAYRNATGDNLLEIPEEEARRFFMATNLEFQRNVLEPAIRRQLPNTQSFTFTIPWVFEPHFERIASQIDVHTTIVDWDYTLTEEARARLPTRLKRYGQFGHKVWFMPTSGYAFSDRQTQAEQECAVQEQIRLARSAGISDIVYFMGPFWWPAVEGTSSKPRGPLALESRA